VTDKEGNKTEVNGQDGSWSAKSSDGSEVNVGNGGTRVKNAKGEVSTMGISAVTEAEMGLPYYPGSSAVAGRDMKSNADGKQSLMSIRTSSDKPAKVTAFYKDKIKNPVNADMGDLSSLSGTLEDGRQVAILVSTTNGNSEITITVTSK
jgi:hypothetical protein